jgi:hypothetical protein
MVFLSLSRQIPEYTLKLGTAASFKILYNSLNTFSFDAILHRFTTCGPRPPGGVFFVRLGGGEDPFIRDTDFEIYVGANLNIYFGRLFFLV